MRPETASTLKNYIADEAERVEEIELRSEDLTADHLFSVPVASGER